MKRVLLKLSGEALAGDKKLSLIHISTYLSHVPSRDLTQSDLL